MAKRAALPVVYAFYIVVLILTAGCAPTGDTKSGEAPALPEESKGRASRAIIRICALEDHATVGFAGEELEKYLRQVSGGTAVLLRRNQYQPEANTLWVGCLDKFPGVEGPKVQDPQRDDAIVIKVDNRQGIIAGANPRATLIAVYRYLTELGCRWVRPGADGELIIADSDPLARNVSVSETPSYRHRGACIEGASSCEHVNEFIDWIPKVGMNAYFIEYINGYIYYNNWYSERHKPENAKRLMPDRAATEFAERARDEMVKRDLLIHWLGHGWTSMPLGIPSELWDETIERDFGELTQYIALYQGKRALFRGIPRRTHLCYSNPKARAMMVDEAVKYAQDHPEIDYLHFWLADGSNHCCECDECRKATPSDWYVKTLNELDRGLAAKRLPTRIVFLTYLDLLWPPEKERLQNPDRFVLMFAPLQRSFYEPLDPKGETEPIPPFVLNKLQFPPTQNLNFLAAWRKVFPGDTFVFDYRFMWTQYDDPGFMALASSTAAEAPIYARVGLNGMISDQPQRAFLPSGLPMMVLARTLWKSDLSFDQITADYFDSAFGPDGGQCREFLQKLSDSFDPKWLTAYSYRKKPTIPPEVPGRLQGVRKLVQDFRPVIERNINLPDACQARSWRDLAAYADICEFLGEAIKGELEGDAKTARQHWDRIERLVVEQEPATHPVFDVFLFLKSMRMKYQTATPEDY